MLNIRPTPIHNERGVQNHFSLAVDKIQSTGRAPPHPSLKITDQPEIGRDGKWSFDIYRFQT